MPGPRADGWTALPVAPGGPLPGSLLPLNPEDTVPGRHGGSGERPCGRGPDLCPVKLRIPVLLLGRHGCVSL